MQRTKGRKKRFSQNLMSSGTSHTYSVWLVIQGLQGRCFAPSNREEYRFDVYV